ncbi:REP-associated tyrosine transposase [Sedimenticola hydrogenitrophicus]|uniref:REP-associated tyrosine transposase n=1 Tax=Sedimenticola hydrogenitrophicus TaxID=2967975 RepID=UPI0021A38768|nr:transposase [Sedimenticola hydrogenitrophicus]
MPRRPRLYLPGQPQHVVVRGHNRDPILAHHEDFRFLYRCLREAAQRHALAVHAWVFMHNHTHLLATPEDESSLPRTMQSLGRRYAQYFNRRYHRTGSLWEGRYKVALVDTERYLLACYRYIELNPVRAGIARQPADYSYSSFHANALGKPDGLVTPHAIYLSLVGAQGALSTPTPREAYLRLFDQVLSRKELTEIRRGTETGIGIGRAEFLLKVARLAGGG